MSHKILQNIYASITIIFWSLAFALTKVASTGLSYYSIGLIRATVASIVLLLVGRMMHIRRPFKPAHYLLFAIEGFMGFALYLICFNIGMQTLPSATSSLIIALVPVLTAVGAWRLFDEKLKPAGWISIGTAFVGVCILLFWNADFSIGIGALWTFGAVLLFCGYNLLNRKLTAMGYMAMEIVTYAMCFGALELMVFLPATVGEISHSAMTPILVSIFLGVTASAISYLTWSKAMECAEKISEVTNYMFITPVLAAIEAAIILGEMPDTGMYLGGAVILASVVVFSMKGK